MKLFHSLCLLAAFFAGWTPGRADVAVEIDWRAPRFQTTGRQFSVNAQGGFHREMAVQPAYREGLKYLNPGLLRYHNAGMPKGGWMNQETKTWDAAVIAATLDGPGWPPEKVLINISSWPAWMDADGNKKLDTDQYEAFAALCAELVRILNVEQKRGFKYFEITNEKDFAYWRNKDEPVQVDDLADIYNLAAKAMKKVDPTIKTGGPAAASGEDWVEEIHRRFMKRTLPQLDFFSFHAYPRTRDHTPKEIYDMPVWMAGLAADHRKMLDELSPVRHVELHVNEFNIASNYKLGDTRMLTNEGAVFDSLVLIRMAEQGIDAVNAWSDCDAVYGKMDKKFKLRPPAHVFHYFNEFLVGQVVAGETSDAAKVVVMAVDSEARRAFVLVNRAREAVRVKVKSKGAELLARGGQVRIDADGLHKEGVARENLSEMELPADSVTFYSFPKPQPEIRLTKGAYTTNFDGMLEAKAGLYEWTDGVLMPGWQAQTLKGAEMLEPKYYRATTGKGVYPTVSKEQPTSLLALRDGKNEKEAALGIVSRGDYTAVFGVKFVNKTGATISGLDVSYTGEQWGFNTGGANALHCEYSVDAESLSSGTWKEVKALAFAAPHSGNSTNDMSEGNAEANRRRLTAEIGGLSVVPDGVIWLRWRDDNKTENGNAQVLGVDDLTVKAVTGK